MATSADHDGGTLEVSSGSDVVYDNICQPCKDEGKILEAEGRCEDCDEYLCNRCFHGHTLPRPTRHHVLIGKDQLQHATHRTDQCTLRCPKHHDEIIKYNCLTHSFLGCNACMLLDHESCTGRLYIPEVAKDILNSEEYRKYKELKAVIETKVRVISQDAKERINVVEERQSAVVESFRYYKNEVIDWLEKAEKELVDESIRIKEEEVNKQKSTQEECAAVGEELIALTSSVERFEVKKQYCNMYTELMKIQDKMPAYEDRLDEVDHSQDPYREMFFSPNRRLADEMESMNGMGIIRKESTGLMHDRDIDVKTQSKTNPCFISGSAALPGNKLIVADLNTLKLIDLTQDKVVEELYMSSSPWDVTRTTSDEVAVTLYNNKIAFVTTDGRLTIDREIGTGGLCRGIAYTEGKLLVTFEDPPKVAMMDMQGVVLKTVFTNDTQKDLLKEPLFVSISPINKAIYISDADAKRLICCDSNGTLLSIYNNADLERPYGVTVDSHGMVYLCDRLGHSIHQITKDCKKQRILLAQEDVKSPCSIAFSDTEDRLYVGMQYCNVVKAFKAK